MLEYNDKVIDYLEYLGYPEYVLEFEPQSIAQSISGLVYTFYHLKLSYRIAALSIFGATWEYQILPKLKDSVIN